MTIKMAVSVGVLSVSLMGCGTAATVLQDEAKAAQGLRRQKTYCQSIPRVYSGLAYDFCVLNAPPDPTGILAAAVLVDMVFCGALDTVVLPYTIYRQSVDGNISIYWRPARG